MHSVIQSVMFVVNMYKNVGLIISHCLTGPYSLAQLWHVREFPTGFKAKLIN